MTIEERQEGAKWFQNRASQTPMPGAKMMFERAAEALSEGMQPHWIPCSERLPEKRKENEDTEYLVTIDNGEFKYVTSDYWINWFGNWRWNDSEAIAWMPLPKPYGGESE